ICPVSRRKKGRSQLRIWPVHFTNQKVGRAPRGGLRVGVHRSIAFFCFTTLAFPAAASARRTRVSGAESQGAKSPGSEDPGYRPRVGARHAVPAHGTQRGCQLRRQILTRGYFFGPSSRAGRGG